MTNNKLWKHKIAIAAIQVRSGLNLINKHEFGTAFFVDSKVNHLTTNFQTINERLCILRMKGWFFNWFGGGGQSSIQWTAGTSVLCLPEELHSKFIWPGLRLIWTGSSHLDSSSSSSLKTFRPGGPRTFIKSRGGANIDSDHMLVVTELGYKLIRASNNWVHTKTSEKRVVGRGVRKGERGENR
jgi:hypothetical protein